MPRKAGIWQRTQNGFWYCTRNGKTVELSRDKTEAETPT